MRGLVRPCLLFASVLQPLARPGACDVGLRDARDREAALPAGCIIPAVIRPAASARGRDSIAPLRGSYMSSMFIVARRGARASSRRQRLRRILGSPLLRGGVNLRAFLDFAAPGITLAPSREI